MFMLRNVSKYIFGGSSKESIIEIPQGQLYLVRPLSPKGYSELIFPDAAASIRTTGQPFQYQLVVQRVYAEGEEELLEDDEQDSPATPGAKFDKDEKTLLLDEALRFRSEIREDDERVLTWLDLSGDPEDCFEFVCDPSVSSETVANFQAAAINCQFERKYRKSHELATEQELKEFVLSPDDTRPVAGLLPGSDTVTPISAGKGSDVAMSRVSPAAVKEGAHKTAETTKAMKKALATAVPAVVKHPEALQQLASEGAELHFFDFESGQFVLQDDAVEATVTEVGNWQYWLQVASDGRDWLGTRISTDMNPVFNFEYLSFIFNYLTSDGSAYSWLLRFDSQSVMESFQEGLMQALWEHANRMKWSKMKDDERDYITDTLQDLTMEDAPAVEEEEEEDENEEFQSADEGSDEEDDEELYKEADDKEINSQLAVGYKHDRSFVVRGSKIGVFRHGDNNSLKFSTNINKVATPKGKLFSPKKVMLHQEDSNMILQNEQDPHSLYRLDLETGKVVDEWKIHDDIPVTSFAPEKKYAQMTSEPTFIGLSDNATYRIDPRLSGGKLVDSQLKQYATKNGFTSAATTQNGYLAVASTKGDIRLFDRLGINAKTHLPALGDPVIGIDLSADGRWVLATTKTYLLLIDALQGEGNKNAGKLGFEKAFDKDKKPQPRRLALKPSHVAQMQHETKNPLSFTPAHFNAGVDSKETTIITATGPYIVTWSMKKVLKGTADPYHIKRYEEVVKADDFKFGTDKNMIVTLPNEVGTASKGQLKKPTRESIVGFTPSTPRRSTARGTRGSYLKNSIVDSPY